MSQTHVTYDLTNHVTYDVMNLYDVQCHELFHIVDINL